jgi:hypothetical protein
VPIPNTDPNTELQLLRAAFDTPQASVALSTIHTHAAPNASFAAHTVHADKAEWIAAVPAILPAAFRFPLFLSDCEETERTATHSRWNLWAANTDKSSFYCTLTLTKNPDREAEDPPERARSDPPDPHAGCWRLASFDILRRSD